MDGRENDENCKFRAVQCRIQRISNFAFFYHEYISGIYELVIRNFIFLLLLYLVDFIVFIILVFAATVVEVV